MIAQKARGSLLTKRRLDKHFYRAKARHEINWRSQFMNGHGWTINIIENKGNIDYDHQNYWNGKLPA